MIRIIRHDVLIGKEEGEEVVEVVVVVVEVVVVVVEVVVVVVDEEEEEEEIVNPVRPDAAANPRNANMARRPCFSSASFKENVVSSKAPPG